VFFRVMPSTQRGIAMAAKKAPAIVPSTARPSETDSADFYDDFGLSAHWGERIITAVAATLGITIVAAVALLMGMA
jgi:hypothetical protein